MVSLTSQRSSYQSKVSTTCSAPIITRARWKLISHEPPLSWSSGPVGATGIYWIF
jgi:hypothetical protein